MIFLETFRDSQRTTRPISNQKPDTLQIFTQQTSLLASNLLLSRGFIKEKVFRQREIQNTDNKIMKAIVFIQMGLKDCALNILKDPKFKRKHKFFLMSGKAIWTALGKGYVDLALQLRNEGYGLPKSMLADKIIEKDYVFTKSSICSQLYNGVNIPLILFLLKKNEWYDLIDIVLEQSGPIDKQQLRKETLKQLLQKELDELACEYYDKKPIQITNSILRDALGGQNMQFLRKIWHLSQAKNAMLTFDKIKRRKAWKNSTELQRKVTLIDVQRKFALSTILEAYLRLNNYNPIYKIIQWAEVEDDRQIISTLLKHRLEDAALIVIQRGNKFYGPSELECAIKFELMRITQIFVKRKQCRLCLGQSHVQDKLSKLVGEPTNCEYAADLLSWIQPKQWNNQHTKDLCQKASQMIKRGYKFLACPSHLKFIVLFCEFLQKLLTKNIEYNNLCQRTLKLFLQLGKRILESIKDDSILKFHLNMTDSQRRKISSVIAQNRFYVLLESQDVENYVSKVWMGNNIGNSIIFASTIYRSLSAPLGSKESLQFLKKMDFKKHYLFQMKQWVNSCRLRFTAQAMSTIILAILYTLMIHTATDQGVMYDISQSEQATLYLRCSQFLISGVFIEQALHILYGYKTQRGYIIDGFKIVDFLMFLTMITLMLELNQNLMGKGHVLESFDPKIFNIMQHSFQLALVWLRFIGIMVTHRTIGPLIRMLNFMIQEVIPFNIIFFILLLASASSSTALLHQSINNNNFSSFFLSLQTLYSAALGIFDMESFKSPSFIYEGFFGMFLVISYVMLLHVLIAVLNYEYEMRIKRMDSEYTAVLIAHLDKWNWDDKFGILIFMPSPFTWIIGSLVPFIAFLKPSKKLNTLLTSFFFIFYAIPMFAYFSALSFLMIIPVWIKAFWNLQNLTFSGVLEQGPGIYDHFLSSQAVRAFQSALHIEKQASWSKIFIWILCGPFRVFYSWLKDCIYFWIAVYTDNNSLKRRSLRVIRVNQQVISRKFIKILYNVLNQVTGEEIVVDELAGKIRNFCIQQDIHLSNDWVEVKIFLSNFAYTKKNPILNVKLLKNLIPLQKCLTSEQIKLYNKINIPFAYKGLTNFQREIGAVEFQGVLIPKQLASGESQELKDIRMKFKHIFCDFSRKANEISNLRLKLRYLSQKYIKLGYNN